MPAPHVDLAHHEAHRGHFPQRALEVRLGDLPALVTCRGDPRRALERMSVGVDDPTDTCRGALRVERSGRGPVAHGGESIDEHIPPRLVPRLFRGVVEYVRRVKVSAALQPHQRDQAVGEHREERLRRRPRSDGLLRELPKRTHVA